MHPQENVIAVQTLLDVEGRNIRYAKPGINRQENEILGILSAPRPMPRPLRRGSSKIIARLEQTAQFVICEWHLVCRYGRAFRSLEIVGDILVDPFAFAAK